MRLLVLGLVMFMLGIGTADAQHRDRGFNRPPGHSFSHRPPGHWRPHYRPHQPNPSFWGPIIGGITGFIIGRESARDDEEEAPPPVKRGTITIEPWTQEWYDYCGSKYRSFDAKTGYYNGYDGNKHFCR